MAHPLHARTHMTMTPPVRRSPLWVLFVLLLAPGLCLAGERAPLRLTDDDWYEEGSRSSSRGGRIAAELGLGAVTATVLGIGGGFAGLGICEAGVTGGKDSYLPCLDAAFLGVAAGVLAGVPLGVWWGGGLMDGHGRLLATFLGMGAGVLVGATAGALSERFRTELFLVGTPLLALTGAVVGYELSHVEPWQASVRPRFQPVLALSSHGAALGLGGRF